MTPLDITDTQARDRVAQARRVVVKVGSSSLTSADGGRLDVDRVSLIVDALAARIAEGVRYGLGRHPELAGFFRPGREPFRVLDLARAAGLRAIPTGIDHGTVTLVADHTGLEVTTLRRDVETDGRRAVVAFTDDWVEDAARRDLTLNALYLDPGGSVYGPMGGGLADARAGRIRFVGDPETRIREDVLRILAEEGAPDKTVMHCFSGDVAMARECADRGYYLSIAGTVTFKNARGLRDALAVTPPERLLVETDAPYLTPSPYRGSANAPYLLPHTVRRMADVLSLDVATLCGHLSGNAEAVYGPW